MVTQDGVGMAWMMVSDWKECWILLVCWLHAVCYLHMQLACCRQQCGMAGRQAKYKPRRTDWSVDPQSVQIYTSFAAFAVWPEWSCLLCLPVMILWRVSTVFEAGILLCSATASSTKSNDVSRVPGWSLDGSSMTTMTMFFWSVIVFNVVMDRQVHGSFFIVRWSTLTSFTSI